MTASTFLGRRFAWPSAAAMVGTVVGLVASLILASPVRAQGTQAIQGWAVTPFLGIGFGGNLEASTPTGGVAAGFSGRTLGFEAEVARLHAEQGFPTRFETNVWSYALNGLWHFNTDHAFVPYALAGVAWQRATADLDSVPGGPFPFDDPRTELSLNVGAGIKTVLTERAGLRVDLRYTNGRELAPDYWRLAAGFSWKLGGR